MVDCFGSRGEGGIELRGDKKNTHLVFISGCSVVLRRKIHVRYFELICPLDCIDKCCLETKFVAPQRSVKKQSRIIGIPSTFTNEKCSIPITEIQG